MTENHRDREQKQTLGFIFPPSDDQMETSYVYMLSTLILAGRQESLYGLGCDP